jgi:hypothetical protein
MLPDWAQAALTKGYEVFSGDGELNRLMIAVEMRNGSRIAVLRTDATVLLLRAAT